MVRGRILAAGLVLLGAGFAVLGSGSRSGQVSAKNEGVSTVADFAGVALGEVPGQQTPQGQNTALQAHSLFAGLPLLFEPNQGQRNLDPADPRAKFVARGSGYSLFLGTEGAILSLISRDPSNSRGRVDSVQMKLAGANANPILSGDDLMPGKSNYFIGNDPSRWRVGVPQFARVRYENIYPGINLVFYGNQGHLEYDFQVAPGADPAQAELEFNGVRQLALKDGALVIKTADGSMQLEAPRVYQEIAGRERSVDARFELRGKNRAGFAVGAFDRSRELIIDPILTFSTFFGGSGDEHSTSVAVDGSFNIFLAGSTTSPDLPALPGVVQTTLGGTANVYIAKITPPLSSLAAVLNYVTYLGGDGSDTPAGIKVDGASNPFLAGTTTSTNFPTTATNAYQTAPASAGQHVFVTKLKNDGTALLYSSYLSGNGTDIASGMTIDAGGNLYVTGTTTSVETGTTDQFPASNLPQSLPYQSTSRAPGLAQFFVTKVNTNAPRNGSISYSTYFGGGTFDTPAPVAIGGGIAVDSSNNVYFTGTTNFLYAGCSGCNTTDFPILNAYQPCLDQAPPTTIVNPPTCSTTTTTTAPDAFVAKLNLNPNSFGTQLVWSTFLGGSGTDSGAGIALDSGAANVFVVGTTNSPDIAKGVTSLSTSSAFQRCLDQPVNPAAGTACTPPASPADDAFVARLTNPAGTSTTTTNPVTVTLNYFSYAGGTGAEQGRAITVDSASGALITGWTRSGDFPVLPATSSIQSALNGPQDAFVARLNTSATVGQTTTASWASYFGGSGTDTGTGITLDPNQNTYLVGETNSADLQVAKPLSAAQGGGYKGGYDAFVTQLGTAVSLSLQGVLNTGTQSFISAGTPATFTYTITNNGPDLANNITVTDNLSSALTIVPLSLRSASVTGGGTCGGASSNSVVSCTVPSLQSGSTATVTIEVIPSSNANGNPATFNGGTVQVVAPGNIVLAQTSVPANMSDFSMTVSPSSQSVPQAGKTAVYQVSLSPHPLFTSTITVSCSNLPTGASCPSQSTTLQSTSIGTVSLAISTTARPITTGSLFTRGFYAAWFGIPGLSLLFVGISGDRRRRRIAGVLMLCVLFSLILLVPACSSSNKTQTPPSGTPPGQYTITITASASGDTKSQTVVLNVP